jgi:hypothetical protein
MLPTILRSHPLKHGYVENTKPIVFRHDAGAMELSYVFASVL